MSSEERVEVPSRDRVAEAILFLLPILATTALYLPSGLAMPARLLTVAGAVLAVWQVIETRYVPAPRVLLGIATTSACFVVFGGIAMLRYPDRTSTVDAAHVAFLVLTCLTLAVLTTRRRRVLAGVLGWLASAALAAVIGFWEVITANHLPGNLPAQQYAGRLPGWNEISSFFDNPNLYAYHLVVTLLLVPVFWGMAGTRLRWFVPPVAIAFAYLLYRTDGRMAILTLAVGVLLWCLRYRWSQLVGIAAIALTGLTGLLNLFPGRGVLGFVKLALDNIQWKGTSTWVRAEMARSGWWMCGESGYLGVGPGGYSRWAFDPDNPHTYQKLNNAHWGVIEVLAEYGVVTLVVLVAALVGAAVFALRTAASLRRAARNAEAAAHENRSSALNRTLAVAGAIAACTVPLLCISHSTWLRQPLTAAHLGTVVSLIAFAEVIGRQTTDDRLEAI